MPIEGVAEVVVEVAVQAAGEAVGEAGKEVNRRFGWKGCVVVIAVLTGLGVGLYFLLA